MSGALPVCDAHHHLWDLGRNYHPWLSDEPAIPFRYGDYAALRRNYAPRDYRRDARGHDVRSSVYMEAEWDPADPLGETAWIEAVAREAGLPQAMIGQARLDRPDAEEVLAAQAARPILRGVRHKPPSAEAMDGAAWRRGYAALERLGLIFELQCPWAWLGAAGRLADDFPGAPIVLNHAGLPADRSPEGLAGWRRALEAFADRPNALVKISGLGQPGRPWTVEANGPVVRDAIRIFGTGRAMFASNFPVDGLVASFDRIYSGFKAITADLPDDARRALFHDNAVRVYGLDG